MSRFVVEKLNSHFWRILDTRYFRYEYVLFDLFRPECGRMWVMGDLVEENESWIRAECEERLADAMLRRKMQPPRVVGHLPPVTMMPDPLLPSW